LPHGVITVIYQVVIFQDSPLAGTVCIAYLAIRLSRFIGNIYRNIFWFLFLREVGCFFLTENVKSSTYGESLREYFCTGEK
jgi:hypothetical protein